MGHKIFHNIVFTCDNEHKPLSTDEAPRGRSSAYTFIPDAKCDARVTIPWEDIAEFVQANGGNEDVINNLIPYSWIRVVRPGVKEYITRITMVPTLNGSYDRVNDVIDQAFIVSELVCSEECLIQMLTARKVEDCG